MEAIMKLSPNRGLSQALKISEEQKKVEADKRARALGFKSSDELKEYLVQELEKAYQA